MHSKKQIYRTQKVCNREYNELLSEEMSRASKITLGLSCVLTTCTIVGVHMVQGMERDTLHQGPIKDAKRVAEKKLEREREQSMADPERERKRQFNKVDHDLQQELRKKYESMQPLSGEISREPAKD